MAAYVRDTVNEQVSAPCRVHDVMHAARQAIIVRQEGAGPRPGHNLRYMHRRRQPPYTHHDCVAVPHKLRRSLGKVCNDVCPKGRHTLTYLLHDGMLRAMQGMPKSALNQGTPHRQGRIGWDDHAAFKARVTVGHDNLQAGEFDSMCERLVASLRVEIHPSYPWGSLNE